MIWKNTAFVAALALSACAPTVLETPDFVSCDKEDEPINRWPWFESETAPDDSNVGFQVGQTAPDFRLVDQFGDEVCLWQLTGKVVLLDASALWCGPCMLIAEHTACVAESFGDELVYVTFISQGEPNEPAVQGDNTYWADTYGLSDGSLTPVLADGNSAFVRNTWVVNYPSFMLLDRDMTIIAKGDTRVGERAMRDEAEKLLGAPTSTCEGTPDEE